MVNLKRVVFVIEFRAYDYSEDEAHDNCGNLTVANLKINGMSIDLCRNCVQELFDGIETFKSTIFCHQCKYWEQNKYGYVYDGTCRKKAEIDGYELNESDIGYMYGTNFMHTCKYVEE